MHASVSGRAAKPAQRADSALAVEPGTAGRTLVARTHAPADSGTAHRDFMAAMALQDAGRVPVMLLPARLLNGRQRQQGQSSAALPDRGKHSQRASRPATYSWLARASFDQEVGRAPENVLLVRVMVTRLVRAENPLGRPPLRPFPGMVLHGAGGGVGIWRWQTGALAM